MDNEGIKDALLKKYPVICENKIARTNIEYRYVTAIIYRVEDGKLYISGELLDKNKNTIVTVPIEWIKKKE